jgi:hypothetical protein
MSEMASERTPLLGQTDVESHSAAFHEVSSHQTLWHVLKTTVDHHWVTLSGCVLSSWACSKLGFAKVAVFDDLLFKPLFVIFGFAIGFRNLRANTRRSQALASVRGLLQAVWDLLVLLPVTESREMMCTEMLRACELVAKYVTCVAMHSDYKYALAGLEPQLAKGTRLHFGGWGESDTGRRTRGPGAEVESIFLKCEDEVDRLTAEWKTQKFHRTFWSSKTAFKKEFGALIDLATPSVSDGYRMLIRVMLFGFAVIYPWGLISQHITYHDKIIIDDGTFLMLNSLMVCFFLLAMNAQASEQEDPFHDSYTRLDFVRIVAAFRAAVEDYEQERRLEAPESKDDLAAGQQPCADVEDLEDLEPSTAEFDPLNP